MISFRYHAVSLLAVLLALAAGVILGSGPLQAQEDPTGPDGDTALAAARSQVAKLDDDVHYADSYARATAARLVAGALDGRTVTLVTLPGADPEAVGTLSDLVGASGGTVTARVDLGRKLLDVGNRQLVTELAAQMTQSAKGQVQVPEGATGYEAWGRLVAHAVLTGKGAGEPVDDAGDAVLAAVSTADLLTRANVERRGSLALVVAGDPYGSADERQGAGGILAALLTAFDATGDGVVLAGPGATGIEDGVVAAVRSDSTAARAVSTVDVADQASGQVAAVLALAEQARGGSGQYGSDSAPDGAVPPLGSGS